MTNPGEELIKIEDLDKELASGSGSETSGNVSKRTSFS